MRDIGCVKQFNFVIDLAKNKKGEDKMSEKAICKVVETKFDNLTAVHEAIDKFANNKLSCEINGRIVGSINKLFIDYDYEWNSTKRRIIVKAEVSLY
jgi:hypothetical protein